MMAKTIDDTLIREMLYWLEFDLQAGVIRWKRGRRRVTVGVQVGCINKRGYRVFIFNGENFYAHRILMAFHEWLSGRELHPEMGIDHIDRNPSNNCIDNLRIVPQSLNSRNAKMQPNNTSGVTGVSWEKATGKWQAHCMVDGKNKRLGSYDCIYEAEAAVKAFRLKHGFTDGHGEAS